jgi:hypothetical protein
LLELENESADKNVSDGQMREKIVAVALRFFDRGHK